MIRDLDELEIATPLVKTSISKLQIKLAIAS